MLTLTRTECFSEKLRILLQISEPEIGHDIPLVELGVDSLVAVEVRSWFLKELKVDLPVLKVVGGASLAELCQRALERLPEKFVAGKRENKLSKPVVTRSLPEPRVADSIKAVEDTSTPASLLSPDNDSASSHSSTQLSSDFASSEDLAESTKPNATFAPAAAPAEQQSRKFLKSEQISFGQSRFWFLGHLLEDQTTFTVAFYYHVTGNLRVTDMERAVAIVAARHEALRTCFIGDQNEADQAYQKVMSSSTLRLEHKMIKSAEDVAAEYTKLQAQVFDLATGKLMRLLLLSLSSSSHYLLFNYHHIIMDGSSLHVFLADLEKAYNGQSLGEPPRQFPDFSAAQRKAVDDREWNDELRYWHGVFPAGEEQPILPLLPMARTSSRRAMKDFDTHQVRCRLESRIVARIRSVSSAQRSTPFHFYLAAFKAMLFCFTDAQDLTIGIADANRSDGDVKGSIGFFLNLLTLRFRRQSDQRFADALREARDISYAALGNSRLPFDVLLEELNVSRSSSHSPFFQAFFDYRPGLQEKHPWGDCKFEAKEMHPGRTAYDFTLDIANSSTDALVIFRVQKSLYDMTAANLLLETYVHLVDILSSDVSLPLKATPLFGETQRTDAIKLGHGERIFHPLDSSAN